MALIELGLSRHSGPPLSRRSAEWRDLLTSTEAAIITGQIPSSWKPGILGACTSRLSGVLAGARVDPRVRPLLPFIARQIVESGEVVLLLDNDLRLLPVNGFEMQGTAESRLYKSLTINGPSRTVEYRNVSREQVIHAVIRPISTMPWRGEHWRQTGFTVPQLWAVDRAIQQDAGAPRGTVLPVSDPNSPSRASELLQGFVNLKGGMALHPLEGRSYGESAGPPPRPLRLQSADLDQLKAARESLAADLAEALGFSRVTLGIGQGGQVSRPDGLRSWIASTASAWAATLRDEFERVYESPVEIDLEPVLSRLVPFGQRLTAAARLVDKGWSKDEAERLAGLR